MPRVTDKVQCEIKQAQIDMALLVSDVQEIKDRLTMLNGTKGYCKKLDSVISAIKRVANQNET